MRPYEVMIIFDPTLEEEAVRAEVDRSAELIRSQGGKPGRVERWGKRRLAYEIRHHREGSYVVMEAEAESATMADLDRALLLADGVMRHKVIHLPERPDGTPARPIGTVGPDNEGPSREPATPTPQPASVQDPANGASE